VRRAPEWWSHKYDSGLHDDVRRKAVVHLTATIENNENLSVIGLAVKLGAAQIIDELFNLENIYRFDEDGEVAYDVTYLNPDKRPEVRWLTTLLILFRTRCLEQKDR